MSLNSRYCCTGDTGDDDSSGGHLMVAMAMLRACMFPDNSRAGLFFLFFTSKVRKKRAFTTSIYEVCMSHVLFELYSSMKTVSHRFFLCKCVCVCVCGFASFVLGASLCT